MTSQKSQMVMVENVAIGGGAPIVIQSMTNTDTADIEGSVAQVIELAEAGSELVRLTVDKESAAKAIPEIRNALDAKGYDIPLVGDFHYNGHTLLKKYPDCAKVLAKYRINPGNVGFGKKHDGQFATMIEAAIEYDKPVRIGVNWGSLDQALLAKLMDENAKLPEPKAIDEVSREALIASALTSAEFAEELGLTKNKIIISCKVSRVQDLIKVYRELAKRSNYALHLGLTEAGMGDKGVVSSTVAMSILLQEGIGDTIRVSLTPEPNTPRSREVRVAQEILQSLELRAFSPQITSCPGCGRTTSTFFQELTASTTKYIAENIRDWKEKYSGVEDMTIAVMGCIVNGPGESKHANIGISLPGTGESPAAPVFIDGKKAITLRGDNIAGEFHKIIAEYVGNKYSSSPSSRGIS